jgi:hypothetical protein
MSFTRVIRRAAKATRAPLLPRPMATTPKAPRPILHLKTGL